MINNLEDLERVRDECRSFVTQRSIASATAAIVPAPGLDVAADLALLTHMLPEINKRFGLDKEQVERLDPRIAQQIVVVATSLGNRFIASTVTRNAVVAVLKRLGVRVATKSVTKYIPFVGQAVSATISFGAMKMLGNQHVNDCFETVMLSRFPATDEPLVPTP